MKAAGRNGHSHTLKEKLTVFTIKMTTMMTMVMRMTTRMMRMTMRMRMTNLYNGGFNLYLPPALVEGSWSERASLLISVHCLHHLDYCHCHHDNVMMICSILMMKMMARVTMEAA